MSFLTSVPITGKTSEETEQGGLTAPNTENSGELLSTRRKVTACRGCFGLFSTLAEHNNIAFG